MAHEQLVAFIRAIRSDPGLQQQCSAQEAADADDLATIARSAGFAVHSDDLVHFQGGVLVEYTEEDFFMKPRWWDLAELPA